MTKYFLKFIYLINFIYFKYLYYSNKLKDDKLF